MSKTLALVVSKGQLERLSNESLFHRALTEHFQTETAYLDDGVGAISGLLEKCRTHDAVLFNCYYRDLERLPEVDWAGFQGPRILYETDLCQNRVIAMLERPHHVGRLREPIERLGFSHVITTDHITSQEGLGPNLKVGWLPKYYVPDYFRPLDAERTGFCCAYGTPYDARRCLTHSLRGELYQPVEVEAPYAQLNQTLNRFLACLVCNFGVEFSPSPSGFFRRLWKEIPGLTRFLLPRVPHLGCQIASSMGTMFKNFEACGAGCAPFMDDSEELTELGFQDGLNAVTYCNFDDLKERLQHYFRSPKQLLEIGRQAELLVRTRHTLQHRMVQLETMISRFS
ncbi:MAG: glycosyltransferase family 1 protein [Candidatus Eremiobacteraeota bacterium]|nr:glycosyltransferase family 1 protein [Candidatus Eremiobacteraeota bacterium]